MEFNFNKQFFLGIFLFALVISVPILIYAQTDIMIDFNIQSYLFRLYYDNGQLFADRDYEFKYDVSADPFVPETTTVQFPYRGEVVNLLNQVVSVFQFDPKGGNIKFVKGSSPLKLLMLLTDRKSIFTTARGSN
ncbi:MAG: hypothetical protein UU84_C0050G0002 [Candidatus Yanofskybacteria bacterium GW2011_GWC2_41_9]|uniref:Uncharacterized protein n=1 Tax=Candidatus Yanofskybacteria bacterium GW2011_GWC2_41_9 TaxID=1619029 RepID=A0A0G0XJ84_9BACT|nr:MAG: hypothetical protein UU84_C0050G0002 [Candidatus Yanofskybacteria bacterium GW2011_GWC2_41_9]